MKNTVYILVMAAVIYVIRLLPMTFFRKQIKNRFVSSFFYYVPYVTLSVMTFPAIIEATGNYAAGTAALAAGVFAAFAGAGLFPVSVVCCATAFVAELITHFFL